MMDAMDRDWIILFNLDPFKLPEDGPYELCGVPGEFEVKRGVACQCETVYSIELLVRWQARFSSALSITLECCHLMRVPIHIRLSVKIIFTYFIIEPTVFFLIFPQHLGMKKQSYICYSFMSLNTFSCLASI